LLHYAKQNVRPLASDVTRNYTGKPAAADQDLFDVAQALMGLQSYPVAEIARVDNASLVSE
jgi:hypothetical protein